MAFSLFTNLLDNFKKKEQDTQKAVSGFLQSIGKATGQAVSKVSSTVNRDAGKVSNAVTGGYNQVRNTITPAASNVSNALKTLINYEKGAVNKVLDAKPFDNALRAEAKVFNTLGKVPVPNNPFGTMGKIAGGAANLTQDLTVADMASPVQTLPRLGAGAIMELIRGGDASKKLEYTPKTIPEKIVFGSMPLRPLGDAVQQAVDVSNAASQWAANKVGLEKAPVPLQIAGAGFAPALIGLAAGVEAVPGGKGVTKVGKELAEGAAARVGKEVAQDAATTVGKKIITEAVNPPLPAKAVQQFQKNAAMQVAQYSDEAAAAVSKANFGNAISSVDLVQEALEVLPKKYQNDKAVRSAIFNWAKQEEQTAGFLQLGGEASYTGKLSKDLPEQVIPQNVPRGTIPEVASNAVGNVIDAVDETLPRVLRDITTVKPENQAAFEAAQNILPKDMQDATIGLAMPATKASAAVKAAEKLAPELVAAAKGAGGKAYEEAAKATKTLKNNIRYDKLDIPEEGQNILNKIFEENDMFTAQRRGVQSFEDTAKAAENIIPNIKLKAGKILNAEEKLALGNLVSGYTTRIDELAKTIREGADTTENTLKLAKLRTELNYALASLSGSKTETGRALSIDRKINKALNPEARQNQRLIEEAFAASGGKESLQKIAQRLGELGDDTTAKVKFIRSIAKTSVPDLIDFIWYNNLLSGFLTQVRNLSGALFEISTNVVSSPAAATVDAVKTAGSRVTGGNRQREVLFGELPSEVKGIITGAPEAWRKGWHMVKNGYTDTDLGNASDLVLKKEIGPGILNLVSRGMSGADLFMKSLVASGELRSLAYREVKRKGLKGEDAKKAFTEFLQDPPESAIRLMKNAAEETTFTKPLGEVAQGLSKVRQNIKIPINGKDYEFWNPVKLIIPFANTVINITKRGVENSGVGIVTGAARGTGREASKVQGRAIMGAMGLYALSVYASDNKISGSGPRDKNLRASLMATGWRPNSIKVGDKWYSYQAMGSASIPLSIMGNYYDGYVYNKEDFGPADVAVKVVNTLLDTSMLSGMNDVITALQYEDVSGILKRTAATAVVPFSSASRTATRMTDDTIRDTSADTFLDGLGNSIKANIPGLSKTLPARKDIFGEDVKTSDSASGQLLKPLLDVFNTSKEKNTPEAQALRTANDVGARIPTTAKTVKLRDPQTNTDIQLDADQRRVYEERLGKEMRKAVVDAIQAPDFAKLSPTEKKDLIEFRTGEAQQFLKDTFLLAKSGQEKADFQKIGDLALQTKTEEFYQKRDAGQVANDFYTIISTGQGNKQELLQNLGTLKTEAQAKEVQRVLEKKITGGTEFEDFLKSKDTGVRAAYVSQKLDAMPASERGAFLANLAQKKIITNEVVQQMLQYKLKQRGVQLPAGIQNLVK